MLSGLELAGRYRLEAPLGTGGMGEVWQGLDLRMRRPVAVKILPLSGTADGDAVARFQREAENAAALNHPGITTVHDVGEHTDGGLRLLFLVMELMHGRDLAAVLKENRGGLPIPQVTNWAMQILDALATAHRHGVVHRDIKPANLFLTDDGRVKVCDFGISRLANATKITVTGSAVGTPPYMAPEQIEGRALDERTDLYAFGCVSYQLLTGITWVKTDSSIGAIFNQHLNQTPVPPQSVRPEIDDGLSTLVLDLLAKDPQQRPDALTTAERLHAIQQLLDKDPVNRSTAETELGMRSGERDPRTPTPRSPMTLTNSRGEMVRGAMSSAAKSFAILFAICGLLFPLGDAGDQFFEGAPWFVNSVAAGMVMAALGATTGGVLGLIIWVNTKSDILTLDNEQFTVTRWEGNKRAIFSIHWEALERIEITGKGNWAELCVWFRPCRQPTSEWMEKHHVRRSAGGGYTLYSREAHVNPGWVNPGRLREALPLFAKHLLDDPDNVPDP